LQHFYFTCNPPRRNVRSDIATSTETILTRNDVSRWGCAVRFKFTYNGSRRRSVALICACAVVRQNVYRRFSLHGRQRQESNASDVLHWLRSLAELRVATALSAEIAAASPFVCKRGIPGIQQAAAAAAYSPGSSVAIAAWNDKVLASVDPIWPVNDDALLA